MYPTFRRPSVTVFLPKIAERFLEPIASVQKIAKKGVSVQAGGEISSNLAREKTTPVFAETGAKKNPPNPTCYCPQNTPRRYSARHA